MGVVPDAWGSQRVKVLAANRGASGVGTEDWIASLTPAFWDWNELIQPRPCAKLTGTESRHLTE